VLLPVPYRFHHRVRLSPSLVLDVLERRPDFEADVGTEVYFYEVVQQNENRYKLLMRGLDCPTPDDAEAEGMRDCRAWRLA